MPVAATFAFSEDSRTRGRICLGGSGQNSRGSTGLNIKSSAKTWPHLLHVANGGKIDGSSGDVKGSGTLLEVAGRVVVLRRQINAVRAADHLELLDGDGLRRIVRRADGRRRAAPDKRWRG